VVEQRVLSISSAPLSTQLAYPRTLLYGCWDCCHDNRLTSCNVLTKNTGVAYSLRYEWANAVKLILGKISKIGARPDFRAKIHQVRFWLGFRHRPRWESLHAALPHV